MNCQKPLGAAEHWLGGDQAAKSGSPVTDTADPLQERAGALRRRRGS